MNIKKVYILFLAILAVGSYGCDSGTKVIEGQATHEAMAPNTLPSLQPEKSTSPSATSDVHQVVVEEALNTDKYTYLQVRREGGEILDCYFKNGSQSRGILITSEADCSKGTFLVGSSIGYLIRCTWFSEIWANQTTNQKAPLATTSSPHVITLPDLEVGEIAPAAGAIALSDLFSNKSTYSNQVIKVTGKCVKVNPKIMDLNWVHIQDGSGDNLDLTVTTTESVPLGAVITIEGTITLDKDFGAGYRYDIIMEGARVVK